jgi:hypothetical protein
MYLLFQKDWGTDGSSGRRNEKEDWYQVYHEAKINSTWSLIRALKVTNYFFLVLMPGSPREGQCAVTKSEHTSRTF